MKFISYQDRIEATLNIFSMQGIMLGVLSMLIGIIILRKTFIVTKNYIELSNRIAASILSKIIVGVYCSLIISFFCSNRASNLVNHYVPYNIFKYFVVHTKDKFTQSVIQKNDISRKYSFKRDHKDNNKNIIVVFGEFVAKNDLSLSGYNRRINTPHLEKRKNNIISYSGDEIEHNVFLPSILMRNLSFDQKSAVAETSMISIFRRLGFNTVAISSHTKEYEQESKMNPIFVEAKKVIYRSKIASSLRINIDSVKDHNIVKVIENYFSEHSDKSNLIVVNTMTNRWPYHSLTPEEFQIFQPSCASNVPSHCTAFELRNAYHNSIRYTDYILNEIIKIFELRNSILFYVSNYGKEFEGLTKRYKENDYSMENSSAALLVWVSDSFKEENLDKFNSMEKSNGDRVSMKNIFHSALGCLDIRSESVNDSLNICKQKR